MKKHLLIRLSVLVLVLVSCRLSQFNPFKQVTDYNEPELKIDNTTFTNLGCFDSVDCLPESIKNIEYPITSIYAPDKFYGGLQPALPLAIASVVSFDREIEIPAVYADKCMAAFYVRYLVYVDGEMRLIDSAEGMAELYSPIENENEALSYAIALTGYSALYDLDQHPEYKVYNKPLVESHSKYDSEKFTVHLFDTFICGCGPHIIESVDVTVSPDGTISLSEPVDAFSDPETENICID
jgi:hypothetical protein